MDSFKYKVIIAVIINLIFAVSLNVIAKPTSINVAILPFTIEAKKQNPLLNQKVSSMIKQILEKEGTKVTEVSIKGDSYNNWGYKQFQELGLKSGYDYILTGSLFIAGDSIGIDTKLINVFDNNDENYFFSTSPNLENLYSGVSKVGKSIISKIFQKKIIVNIDIQGNKRIDKDAILRISDIKTGDIVKASEITKDLRKIYEMGYFDNVIVKQENIDTGVKLIYEVTEKSTVRKIKFDGNTVFEDKELEELVTTRTGSILNIHKLKADATRMRLNYTNKNYHNIKIDYELVALENSQADIIFKFEEGDKIRVEKITFEGNKFFDEEELLDTIETSERGFFSFFTSSGDLNEIEVKNDAIRLESLYKNNGFIEAKISDPIIDIKEKLISVTFKIDEGPQYKISKIDITGDLVLPKEKFLELLKSKENELYSRENLRKDILAMSDAYLNKGYANVDIEPLVDKNIKTNSMSINYHINKGELVYFDRIKISGNLKTRDKVIRREIKIIEQGIYSKENIQKTYRNLRRLDLFADIQVTPVKTSKKNKMDLDVSVVEKETGAFSFGGGYSSEDKGFFMISVSERNLFGKGQHGKVSLQLSEENILYNLKFFEPHIMDTDVAGGFDLYREEKEYDYYDKESVGMTLTAGYKLYDYTRIGLYYNIEDFDIENVDSENSSMTPGTFLKSSIKPFIKYDNRNDMFLPTDGYKHELSVEYAGFVLGGDLDYIKYLGETTGYFPLFWKFTGMLHAEAGYIDNQTPDSIDIDYIRFYLGGIHSIRGFDKWDINGRRTDDTRDIGGEKYVQFNAEVTFPLSEEYALAGVIFYDRGDVYRTSEDIDFTDQFSSFGAGFRWNSPMGPLRVEYGWVIDGKDIKDSGDGEFEFSVGASF